jgi:hypothetical protein
LRPALRDMSVTYDGGHEALTIRTALSIFRGLIGPRHHG